MASQCFPQVHPQVSHVRKKLATARITLKKIRIQHHNPFKQEGHESMKCPMSNCEDVCRWQQLSQAGRPAGWTSKRHLETTHTTTPMSCLTERWVAWTLLKIYWALVVGFPARLPPLPFICFPHLYICLPLPFIVYEMFWRCPQMGCHEVTRSEHVECKKLGCLPWFEDIGVLYRCYKMVDIGVL